MSPDVRKKLNLPFRHSLRRRDGGAREGGSPHSRAPLVGGDLVRPLIERGSVAPIAGTIMSPVAVLHKDGLARLVDELGEHCEV